MIHETDRRGFIASDDPDRIDYAAPHGFLKNSYWARGISPELVEKPVQISVSMGLYADHRMIGFARAVTDYATFAYLGDVFVLEAWRGRGLGLFVSRRGRTPPPARAQALDPVDPGWARRASTPNPASGRWPTQAGL